MPLGRLQEVVIDCADPLRLATFWQQVLVATPDDGASVSFQRVLEPKVGKNRVHLDIRVDISVMTASMVWRWRPSAVELGAVAPDHRARRLGGFQVMLDPEGNEFCLVVGDTPTAV